jgi:alkaline phosphatase D
MPDTWVPPSRHSRTERLAIDIPDRETSRSSCLPIRRPADGESEKNFDDERFATLGVEFVATSISSGGDGFDTNDRFKALLAQDPHIKFFNNQRGNVRHTVTPDHWQADFQVVDQVSASDGHVSTRKSFVVETGKNGLAEA